MVLDSSGRVKGHKGRLAGPPVGGEESWWVFDGSGSGKSQETAMVFETRMDSWLKKYEEKDHLQSSGWFQTCSIEMGLFLSFRRCQVRFRWKNNSFGLVQVPRGASSLAVHGQGGGESVSVGADAMVFTLEAFSLRGCRGTMIPGWTSDFKLIRDYKGHFSHFSLRFLNEWA